MYHLVNDGTSWEECGQDIDGEAAHDQLGYSVSLSADESTVAIGAPHNSNNGYRSGQVAVYRFDSDQVLSWEHISQSIKGDNEGDGFGSSVNLSPDGNTFAVGSPGNNVAMIRLDT